MSRPQLALGKLARIQAAQAPTNEADLPLAVARVKLVEPGAHVVLDIRPKSEIGSELATVKLAAAPTPDAGIDVVRGL